MHIPDFYLTGIIRVYCGQRVADDWFSPCDCTLSLEYTVTVSGLVFVLIRLVLETAAFV